MDVLETLTGTLPFDYERLGRYWDKNIEIDIMAFDGEEKNVLLGEIKWQKKPVGIRTLRELREKAKKLNVLSNSRNYLLLTSKSGFTRSLQEMADESVLLFDLRKGPVYS